MLTRFLLQFSVKYFRSAFISYQIGLESFCIKFKEQTFLTEG